jgi:homoserine dehydrogenase
MARQEDVIELRLNLIGFGNVGRELARILLHKGQEFRISHRVDFKVTAIATGRHGCNVNRDGLDLARVLDTLESGKPLDTLDPYKGQDTGLQNALDIIRNAPGDIMLELTPLNPYTGQPAISHTEAALSAGKHVVSANKGPIAYAYSELAYLAARRGLKFLFESTVMDGTPIFNMARYCLRGTPILGFKGILNSTTNFVLGEMEKGSDFHDSVAKAQEMGFAEADPSMDLDGWDAAVKAAVLSNVLMGMQITPRDVDRTGITGVTKAQVQEALKYGKRIKLVAEAGYVLDSGSHCREASSPGDSEKTFYARVMPVNVDAASIFGQIDGTTSCVLIRTGLMGDITLIEHVPELAQTAYGVLNDLLEIAACTHKSHPSR